MQRLLALFVHLFGIENGYVGVGVAARAVQQGLLIYCHFARIDGYGNGAKDSVVQRATESAYQKLEQNSTRRRRVRLDPYEGEGGNERIIAWPTTCSTQCLQARRARMSRRMHRRTRAHLEMIGTV